MLQLWQKKRNQILTLWPALIVKRCFGLAMLTQLNQTLKKDNPIQPVHKISRFVYFSSITRKKYRHEAGFVIYFARFSCALELDVKGFF